MSDEPVLFETEAGLVLLQGTKILAAERKSQVRAQGIAKIGERARAEGMDSIKAMDAEASQELRKLGFNVIVLTEQELNELNTQKISIIVNSGLAPGEQEALDIVRQGALEAAEQKISTESSREDLRAESMLSRGLTSSTAC